MIRFIKWLINEYKLYEMKRSTKKDDRAFMNLFAQCREHGFSEDQVLYILNLVSESKK